MKPTFKKGDWVTVVKSRKFQGTTGLVYWARRGVLAFSPQTCMVQLGSDGPFRKYLNTSLRLAWPDEIPQGAGPERET